MDVDYKALNKRERQRLEEIVRTVSVEQLSLPVSDGWTVAAALAHCAFWDRYALLQWETWEREGFKPLPVDVEALNSACLPQWQAIRPEAAAGQALAAAEAVDTKVEGLDPEFVENFLAQKYGLWRLHTYEHRGEHLDEIERSLGRT